MKQYIELPGFEHVYLEESYVLAVVVTPASVVFEMEIVLTAKHPEYSAPGPESFECYRVGRLEFGGVSYLEWSEQGSPPATDASGEIDYGHIDSFMWDSGQYELEGDWGVMKVTAATVMVAVANTGP